MKMIILVSKRTVAGAGNSGGAAEPFDNVSSKMSCATATVLVNISVRWLLDYCSTQHWLATVLLSRRETFKGRVSRTSL